MGDCVYTAFGMRCLAAGMKAKSGVITRSTVTSLFSDYDDFGLDDADALAAVQAFADIVDHDPAGAGDDLLEFVTSWRKAEVEEQARQIAKALPEQDPNWGQALASPPKSPDPEPAPKPAPKAVSKPGPSPAQPRFDWQDRSDLK